MDAHIILLYARETVLRTATRGSTQQESTTDREKQRKIWKEKERVKCKKGGLGPQKQRFGSTKVKVWHSETSTKVIRVGRYEHPRRSVRMSASVGADVCVGRYEHLRRSMRASASVDADDKSREYEEEKRWGKKGKEGCKRGERGMQAWGKRGAWVWQGCHTLLR